jgi:hypothetical protein
VNASTRARGLVRIGAAFLLASAVPAGTAAAQEGRLVAGVGVRWLGKMPSGAVDATETAPNSTRYRLFATDTVLASAAQIDTSVGVRLTRAIEAEVSASYGSADLRTQIASDVEGIPDAKAAETVNQLALEASLLVHLARWAIAGRATPFATAGGGYLRHLHEGRTLAETGSIYHVGGGVTLLLGSGRQGWLKGTGLKVDARAVARAGGVAFDERPHVAPALGVSFFARFQ